MDAAYNKTHIGGGFHRSFDGSHTFKGSYDAIKDRVGEVDPVQYVQAHFRELVTPEGIPLFTLDKARYDSISNEISETLGGGVTPGMVRGYLRDINSFNAGDLCAAGLGTVFLVAAFRSGDPKAVSRVVAGNLCLGIATANPVQLILGVGGLACGLCQGKIRSYELLRGAAPVIMGVVGYHTASKIFDFGKGGSLVFSVGASIATHMFWEHLDKKRRRAIENELGKKNPHYIAAMTPNIVEGELLKLSRRFSPTGLGGLV